MGMTCTDEHDLFQGRPHFQYPKTRRTTIEADRRSIFNCEPGALTNFANLANRSSTRTPLAPRLAIPELDYPDVSADFVVMAALGGGHPEKHKVFQVMTGWPDQARP